MSGITENDYIGLSLGKRLVSARRKANISQLELSVRTGISKDQLSRIELGKSIPKLETIRKIEICLGLSEWALLTDEVTSFIIMESSDNERSSIYRQIIRELENCGLTVSQLRIVGKAAISFAESLKK